MSRVLDSSVALAWIYPDETTGEIRQVFEDSADAGATVALRLATLDAALIAAAQTLGVELAVR